MAKRSSLITAAALGAAALCTAALLLAALGTAHEDGFEEGPAGSEATRLLMQESWADARSRCLAVQD